MPIDILEPTTGQPFGPGFWLSVSSDFVGPVESGSYFKAQLVYVADELVVWETRAPTSTQSLAWIFAAYPLQAQLGPVYSRAAAGASLSLRVTLHAPDDDELDDGSVAIVFDPTSGAPFVIGELLNQASAGGFTSADRAAAAAEADQLQVVKAAVTTSFPGTAVVGGIADLLTHPLGSLLRRTLITPDRAGDGCLTRTLGPIGVNAFGIAWDVISYPAGVGLDDGAPDSWPLTFLQLQAIHTDLDSDEFTSDRASFNTSDERWYWNQLFPTRICYWILPGFTVRFYWLTT